MYLDIIRAYADALTVATTLRPPGWSPASCAARDEHAGALGWRRAPAPVGAFRRLSAMLGRGSTAGAGPARGGRLSFLRAPRS